MKPEPLLKSEAPSAELLGLHVAARTEMLKAKVSSYTRKDGTFVAEHHDNRTAAVPKQPAGKARAVAKVAPSATSKRTPAPVAEDDIPDDENPKMSLSRLESTHLAGAIKGGSDLNKHAKMELAGRGLDGEGNWVGFKKAPAAHGLSDSDMATIKDPDRNPIAGHFQTMHPKVLAAAAAGKVDLNALAKQQAMNRGIDLDGKWVGFDRAEQIHGGKARAAAAKESPSVQPDSPQTAHSAASLGVLADHHDAEDQAHDKAASKKGESHPDYDTHVALSALHSSASRLAGKAREASSGDERAIYMGKHAEVKKKIGTHEAKLSGGGMAKSFCWLGGGGAAGDDVPVPMGFRRPAVG